MLKADTYKVYAVKDPDFFASTIQFRANIVRIRNPTIYTVLYCTYEKLKNCF
jgi:hypothetical protein